MVKFETYVGIGLIVLGLFVFFLSGSLQLSEDAGIPYSVRSQLISEPQCESGFRWNYGDVCYHPRP